MKCQMKREILYDFICMWNIKKTSKNTVGL